MKNEYRIGTCSWKYDSWRGLIYPEQGPINYLREYSYYYNTVEIDQWFWSLFKNDTVVLPKPGVVREYAASVPEDFTFCIKVPNSITLTHYYNQDKKAQLLPNPYFLSNTLFEKFIDTLQPLSAHIGPLIFQFEYLNKKKMPDKKTFFDRFHAFSQQLPGGFEYCLELRNPNYLGNDYFDLLSAANLSHVFLHGYYMESIFDFYERYRERVKDVTIIRLHSTNRQEIEKQTGNKWNTIVWPRDDDLFKLKLMLEDLEERAVRSYVFVNNHFEGSAPRTISKINELMG